MLLFCEKGLIRREVTIIGTSTLVVVNALTLPCVICPVEPEEEDELELPEEELEELVEIIEFNVLNALILPVPISCVFGVTTGSVFDLSFVLIFSRVRLGSFNNISATNPDT